MSHGITALGQHTRPDYVGRGMTSLHLDSTLGRTTSGLVCHHLRWAANTTEQRRAWHDITSLGLHARSDDVGRGMKSPPLDYKHGRQCRSWHGITSLGKNTRSDDVGRGMTSPPLDSTHYRQRRAWHDITALGQHTRSNDVEPGMTSPPLDGTHGQTTSGVE